MVFKENPDRFVCSEFVEYLLTGNKVNWAVPNDFEEKLNIKKMKIENINPKTNPKTSIIGFVLFAIGLVLVLMPMFYEPKERLPEYVNWLFLASGFGLLLVPDTILDVFSKVVNKKSDGI